jgi:hypothetical protein
METVPRKLQTCNFIPNFDPETVLSRLDKKREAVDATAPEELKKKSLSRIVKALGSYICRQIGCGNFNAYSVNQMRRILNGICSGLFVDTQISVSPFKY